MAAFSSMPGNAARQAFAAVYRADRADIAAHSQPAKAGLSRVYPALTIFGKDCGQIGYKGVSALPATPKPIAPRIGNNDGPRNKRQRRTGMALKVELKPNERIIIGSCVITNTDQRARLSHRRRQDSDPARKGHPDARHRRHAGQAGLSGGAADVYFAGPAGQSRHLLQPGARYRHRRAERVADHRGHQQQHPERRPLSGAEGSRKLVAYEKKLWTTTKRPAKPRPERAARLPPDYIASGGDGSASARRSPERRRCAPNSSTAAISASISQMSVR